MENDQATIEKELQPEADQPQPEAGPPQGDSADASQPDEPEAHRAEIKISKRKVAAVEDGAGQRFLVFEAGRRAAAIRLEDILQGATPHAREIINRWFEGRKRGGTMTITVTVKVLYNSGHALKVASAFKDAWIGYGAFPEDRRQEIAAAKQGDVLTVDVPYRVARKLELVE